MSMPPLRNSVIWLVMIVAASGCSNERTIEYASASGTVTLDGKPLQDGVVSFESSVTGFSAMSKLDGLGEFLIEKIPVGSYAVSISPPALPDPGEKPQPRPAHYGPLRPVPAKYLAAAASGLTAEVPAAGIDGLKFTLTK
ncbi:hypothetical protein Pan44_08630 [Caulifigura coniformis]|uniref:Carboxypeptidase regulatory-like domain-containing protein n=1 Tax=Caulifigura coniformis TaxID=2527983 RepID=A0A517S9N8_9PLAN|nr:carboxypeptidase-like regulatory domain-containing protein [Caulifigura coniformis]QDT52850.1 hypothetical protein Pan44_08630 [Caulifigura coniformis]